MRDKTGTESTALGALVLIALIFAVFVMDSVATTHADAISLSAQSNTQESSASRLFSERSSTGYFGLDDDGIPKTDRHGIMLVFDGPINPETVSINTFTVRLDDASEARVVDAIVEGHLVFLKLESELESDATPVVGLSPGEVIKDLAGNSASSNRLGAIRVSDGIVPRLSATLSGGSGIGTGDEGPDKLTNGTIDIHVTSDEPLQGAPRIIVICEGIRWQESDGLDQVERDIDDFIANRNGMFLRKPQEPADTSYTCGYDADGDGSEDAFWLTEASGHSLPGENWAYTWRNPAGAMTRLRDGALTVVAFAHDRSRSMTDAGQLQNWASTSASFTLDTAFESPQEAGGGRILPRDGSTTNEPRPFILIEFSELTTVKLESFTFDDVEIKDEVEVIDHNRFLHWPLSVNRGLRRVEVEALDAASNSIRFDFEFEAIERGDFVIELYPGWNAVSVPANPVERSIDTVFTEPSVQAVIGWSDEGWRMAVRRDGVWESNPEYGSLHNLVVGHGYWVMASDFVRQRIRLVNPSEHFFGHTPPIGGHFPVRPGWNFVGVIDPDEDQIENHYGEALEVGNGERITANEYLWALWDEVPGRYWRAYTWDPHSNAFDQLHPADTMTIGDGVWVYYGVRLGP